MKIYFNPYRIPEVAALPEEEAKALISRFRWSIYRSWLGWVALAGFAFFIYGGYVLADRISPTRDIANLGRIFIWLVGFFSVRAIDTYIVAQNIRKELSPDK